MRELLQIKEICDVMIEESRKLIHKHTRYVTIPRPLPNLPTHPPLSFLCRTLCYQRRTQCEQ